MIIIERKISIKKLQNDIDNGTNLVLSNAYVSFAFLMLISIIAVKNMAKSLSLLL